MTDRETFLCCGGQRFWLPSHTEEERQRGREEHRKRCLRLQQRDAEEDWSVAERAPAAERKDAQDDLWGATHKPRRKPLTKVFECAKCNRVLIHDPVSKELVPGHALAKAMELCKWPESCKPQNALGGFFFNGTEH